MMETQAKIASAFVKAQKAFGPALKSSTNPHFRSRYADLSACVEAVIDALNANGIALMQKTYECKEGVMVERPTSRVSSRTSYRMSPAYLGPEAPLDYLVPKNLLQLIRVSGMKAMSNKTWMAMAQGEVKPAAKILARLVCLSAVAPYTYPE